MIYTFQLNFWKGGFLNTISQTIKGLNVFVFFLERNTDGGSNLNYLPQPPKKSVVPRLLFPFRICLASSGYKHGKSISLFFAVSNTFDIFVMCSVCVVFLLILVLCAGGGDVSSNGNRGSGGSIGGCSGGSGGSWEERLVNEYLEGKRRQRRQDKFAFLSFL